MALPGPKYGDESWQDDYNMFKVDVGMIDSIIQGQWEQRQISIDLFLGQCEAQ